MPDDRDDIFPDGWEIRFDRDLREEIEQMGHTVATWEDVESWGLDIASETYRGLFFDWEDAINYARQTGMPCIFVGDEDGVHVWIDYLEIDVGGIQA